MKLLVEEKAGQEVFGPRSGIAESYHIFIPGYVHGALFKPLSTEL